MRTTARKAFAATSALALAVTACGTTGDLGSDDALPPLDPTARPSPHVGSAHSPAPSPDRTTASGTPVSQLGFTTCRADRFTIEYPSVWFTNDTTNADACRAFHPEEFGKVEGENLHYAVRLYIDDVDFDAATRESDDPDESLYRRELTIDGRRAVVEEERKSSSGLAPAGTISYTYLIDLDGQVLVAATHDIGDTDYERDKAVLDRMMETISIA